MPQALMMQVIPKVPAGWFVLFIKGIGGTEVVVEVESGLESWVQFKFRSIQFKGHRDCEYWRFFPDSPCSIEDTSAFKKKIKLATETPSAWFTVGRGFLYSR